MGIPDNSLAVLVQKVRSWLSWGASDSTPSLPASRFEMHNTGVTMCSECDAKYSVFCNGYNCQSCGRRLCPKCVWGCESNIVTRNVERDDSVESLKSCKFCNGVVVKLHVGRKHSEKVNYDSPRESPESPSPSFSGESIQSDRLALYLESRDCGYSPNAIASQNMTSMSAHPSPVSAQRSSSRSDEEEAEDSWKHYYSPSSEYYQDMSDIDSSSVNARLEFYDCKSTGSSPFDSPSRIDFSSYKVGQSVRFQLQEESQLSQNASFDQDTITVLRETNKKIVDLENTDGYSSDLSIMHSKYQKPQKPLDFESNGLIWFPPPPEDENDEVEASFFAYDDDDDDVGNSGAMFSSCSGLSYTFPSKEKQIEGTKERLRVVVHGHFGALVSQLLQGEGIKISREDNSEDWLDIITTIAWQAANFVKPDTSRGGSMDPGDYVKVKCIASGIPSDSTLVKGIVCTKNIKHKRMTTQCRNPRLLLLGGALEYQSVVTSFNTLVQRENDHLKMIMSKIEALRPNVLLVEKSVSPFAQEYLLSKEISLVLNVKKSLLERIGRCTGALISPSIDHISSQLGHCELFHVERMTEEHEAANQLNKKPSKTLMFFEGCPRRLGCTVLLRGASRGKLKRVKHVVQYAVFAAYHLSLETSFLADEGATLPKLSVKPSIAVPERATTDSAISVIAPISYRATTDASAHDNGLVGLKPERTKLELLCGPADIPPLSPYPWDYRLGSASLDAYKDELGFNVGLDSLVTSEHKDAMPLGIKELSQLELPDIVGQEERQLEETYESTQSGRINEDEIYGEHFSAADTYQSILVLFSSRCIVKGTVCERSRLLRIKFYGSFDKPLGRYLRDDLFDQTSYCRSCKEPAEAHVLCYTHQQGNLTINVRSLSSVKLPGEQDGKIWMWHRCLRCAHTDGVPPVTRRVVMSDAAWGLSFGKFLELSFTNHATANRVAPCGHSLQRDCLRFYGFGRMVVFFRYSPIDILNVHLPPSMLENCCVRQEWITKEAAELLGEMKIFYAELYEVLSDMESNSKSLGSEFSDVAVLQNHIMELKEQLIKEENEYNAMLQPAVLESSQLDKLVADILELNRLRRSLLIGSCVWDRKLYSLDSLLNLNSDVKSKQKVASYSDLKETLCKQNKLDHVQEENVSGLLYSQFGQDIHFDQHDISLCCGHLVPEHSNLSPGHHDREVDLHLDGNINMKKEFLVDIPSDISNLSDRIDSAWTGTDPLPAKVQPLHTLLTDRFEAGSVRQLNISDNHTVQRMTAPVRVQSFDSALTVHERLMEGLPPPSLHLSTIRSFHASGDYRSMVRDPVANSLRTYSQTLPFEAQKLNLKFSSSGSFSFVLSASHMAGGARLLLPQKCHTDIVVGVYDDDPASVVAFALSSKEYEDWVSLKSDENIGSWSTNEHSKQDTAASTFSALEAFSSSDLGYSHYGPEDPSSIGSLYTDSKKSPHLTVSFVDDSPIAGGKVKFTVTCYFAKQFDSLRKKCCPGELDFVRSLSRCQRWSAQGGKSNVYFAKSMDERFIIKQVKKTELESFEEFAPEFFKYLTDCLNSGSPSCLAKILGIYQVTVKHLKGGKETKMDLMVMENLFFKRHISRVYDLKGSARSRYNAGTSGTNKVLLDMNLVESLCTEPIFLGSKAKRSLERAIWNDTSFLASVDVMDYSLLVGLDEERKELVLGIIDFMRQYTWDKHLETWVKASGILGGPKNASPTIISPKQYKKRFRKAMTSYFLTVPDQWSS